MPPLTSSTSSIKSHLRTQHSATECIYYFLVCIFNWQRRFNQSIVISSTVELWSLVFRYTESHSLNLSIDLDLRRDRKLIILLSNSISISILFVSVSSNAEFIQVSAALSHWIRWIDATETFRSKVKIDMIYFRFEIMATSCHGTDAENAESSTKLKMKMCVEVNKKVEIEIRPIFGDYRSFCWRVATSPSPRHSCPLCVCVSTMTGRHADEIIFLLLSLKGENARFVRCDGIEKSEIYCLRLNLKYILTNRCACPSPHLLPHPSLPPYVVTDLFQQQVIYLRIYLRSMLSKTTINWEFNSFLSSLHHSESSGDCASQCKSERTEKSWCHIITESSISRPLGKSNFLGDEWGDYGSTERAHTHRNIGYETQCINAVEWRLNFVRQSWTRIEFSGS